MKTPREILLRQHSAANEQLDTIRREAVANIARTANRLSGASALPAWPDWAQLFLSLRGHLAGLGAAWLLVALLGTANSTHEMASARSGRSPSPRQVLMVARENRRQLAELLAPADNKTSPVRTPSPQPRSQYQPSTRSC